MIVRMGSNQQAIYRVSGTIAALVKESTWEELLKGKPVGVIESDPERFSLFEGHKHVDTFKARTMEGAIKAVKLKRPAYSRVEWGIQPDPTYGQVGIVNPDTGLIVYIISGYPDVISLPPDKVAAFKNHGLDAKKCATKVRGFVSRSCGRKESFMGVMAFMDEIDRGTARQGRD